VLLQQGRKHLQLVGGDAAAGKDVYFPKQQQQLLSQFEFPAVFMSASATLLFRWFFYPRELAKVRGYTSCFVVAVAVAVVVAVVVVVACLLVLYSMKQFGILPLQQGNSRDTACMQFGILQLQFGILPLQYDILPLQFDILPLQFGILPLEQVNSRRVHAVWYPATASDCRALVCSILLPCSGRYSGQRVHTLCQKCWQPQLFNALLVNTKKKRNVVIVLILC
jgi:hypothetical protein